MKIAVITPIYGEFGFGSDWHDFCYNVNQIGITRAVGKPIFRSTGLEIEIMKGLIFNPLFSNTGESKMMKEQKALVLDEAEVEIPPEVTSEEKNLVVLEHRPKKRIDETISTPDKYVSRYHYDTEHIDAELELCPHCKKPTFSAFRRTVADSAMNYLLEKEDARDRRSGRRRNIGIIFGVLIFLAGVYFWVFHVISGARI